MVFGVSHFVFGVSHFVFRIGSFALGAPLFALGGPAFALGTPVFALGPSHHLPPNLLQTHSKPTKPLPSHTNQGSYVARTCSKLTPNPQNHTPAAPTEEATSPLQPPTCSKITRGLRCQLVLYSRVYNCRGPRLCGFGLGGYWSSLTIVVPGYEDSGPGGTGPRLFCGPRLCRCGLRGYWSSLTSSIQIPFLPTAGSRRWVAGYWSSLTQRWVLAYPAMGRGATGPRLRVLRTSTEYGGSRWRRTTVTRTRSEGLPD